MMQLAYIDPRIMTDSGGWPLWFWGLAFLLGLILLTLVVAEVCAMVLGDHGDS